MKFTGLLILAVFYAIYLGKMRLQKRKGKRGSLNSIVYVEYGKRFRSGCGE